MTIPEDDDRTPGRRYEVRDNVLLRIVYADVVVAAFSNEESREHVEHLARLLNFKDHKFAELARSTDALRSALAFYADPESHKQIRAAGYELVSDIERDGGKRARAALSGSPAPSTKGLREWQPIETAPRDGTEIDVWVIDAEYPFRKNAHRIANAVWRETLEDWFDQESRNQLLDLGFQATHWMPLPPSPEIPER